MSKRSCCVKGCTNSWYSLQKWREQFCSSHQTNFGTGRCICEPPFVLIPFPTTAKDPHARAIWVKNVNRSSGNRNWEPDSYYSKVCSHHFVDGKPTLLNPYPTLHLGHSDVVKQGRAPPKEREDPSLAKKKRKFLDETKDDCQFDKDIQSVSLDHDYLEVHVCDPCTTKSAQIFNLKAKIKNLESELAKSREENHMLKRKFCNVKPTEFLKSDKKVRFYTGFPSLTSFTALHNILEPKLVSIRYRKGPTFHCNTLKHKIFKKIKDF